MIRGDGATKGDPLASSPPITESACGCPTRRHFLATGAMGIGAVALATLLKDEGLLAQDKPDLERPKYDLAPKPSHAAPRARGMISMFMQGGPSHLDLFDPKQELVKHDGTTFGGDIKYDNAAEASPVLMASPWRFEKRGQCGTEISELLPHLGRIADDIALIRSMRTRISLRANTEEKTTSRKRVSASLISLARRSSFSRESRGICPI